MKTAIKFLNLGLILAAFGAVSISSTYAQATEETCKPIYDKFVANRKGPTIEIYQLAIATGNEFLQKCSTWEGQETIINYVKGQIPKIQPVLDGLIDDRDIYKPFNDSIPKKDWATAFRTGKMAIAKSPDDVDVPLILASIGFDRAFVDNPAVDTYNAESISMAKMVLQKLDQGKTSSSGSYGALGYTYKSTSCPDGKVNAIGWMNYTIGAIMTSRMNQKKEALPYLYKATQVGCETKDRIANVYRLIGAQYLDEFKRLETEKNSAYDILKPLTKDDPKYAEAEKKYLDLVALQKGYMERTMDVYARAYKAAVNAKESAAYIDSQLKLSKQFYGFRNGPKPTVPFDAWLAGIGGRPFVDPTTAVTPIVEAQPTAAPTAMSTTPETTTPAGTDTRPRTAPATGGKPATGTPATGGKPATGTPATTPKTPAKKPAPKKPGK